MMEAGTEQHGALYMKQRELHVIYAQMGPAPYHGIALVQQHDLISARIARINKSENLHGPSIPMKLLKLFL